jgi:hypothetical protein
LCINDIMYSNYLFGLNPKQLTSHDYYLILIIQALSYCELHNVKYIRRSMLRSASDELLREINKRRHGLGGGSFKSLLNRCCHKKFLRVKKVKPKDTRIYPNSLAIKREIEAKKVENLAYGNKRMDILLNNNSVYNNGNYDVVHKKRVITDTYTASEKIDVTVIRATNSIQDKKKKNRLLQT